MPARTWRKRARTKLCFVYLVLCLLARSLQVIAGPKRLLEVLKSIVDAQEFLFTSEA